MSAEGSGEWRGEGTEDTSTRDRKETANGRTGQVRGDAAIHDYSGGGDRGRLGACDACRTCVARRPMAVVGRSSIHAARSLPHISLKHGMPHALAQSAGGLTAASSRPVMSGLARGEREWRLQPAGSRWKLQIRRAEKASLIELPSTHICTCKIARHTVYTLREPACSPYSCTCSPWQYAAV